MQKTKKHMFIIGENEKKLPLYIQEANRLKHLVVVGTKGTGKSTGLLPSLVKQDIEDKKVGVTIIAGEKETALLLYALAKRAGREIVVVKPSLTDSGKLLLAKKSYDYEGIKEDVLDFEKAIQKKQIVIIDMEFARYQERAIQGVAYMLTALQEAVVKENEVNITKHYLYVDDAYLYLPYLKSHLYSGKDYGLGCTLFLESRLQLVKPEERAIVDSMIRNTMLMSGLTLEDAVHYSEDVYEKPIPAMRNRSLKEFIYSTTDKEGRRTQGSGKFQFLSDELLQSLRLAIPRYRGGIEREQVGVESPPDEDKMVASLTKEVEVTTPLVTPASMPGKETAKVPTKPAVKPKKERITSRVEALSKRHVVILSNTFDEDDEF